MHYSMLVLIPKSEKDDIEAAVAKRLAPFDEDLEVPEYEAPCYCIGRVAEREAEAAADAKHGTFTELRERFKAELEQAEWNDDIWEEFCAPRMETARAVFEAHPMKDKPDPECGFCTEHYCPDNQQVGDRFDDGSGCGGTGLILTTRNPNGHWDWYEIGGRWSYGRKNWWSAQTVGNRAFFPTFALLTPDGTWLDRGEGAWSSLRSSNRKPLAQWRQEVTQILAEHQECIAVLVDYHS